LNEASEPSCLNDYDCSHDPTARTPFCSARGICVGCRDDADCAAFSGLNNWICGPSDTCEFAGCSTDADCAANPLPDSTCLMVDAGTQVVSFCGCGSDADCVGQASGTHCDLSLADYFSYTGSFGTCDCQTGRDCPNGECVEQQCSTDCALDSDCGPGNFCDVHTCRPRCDPGHTCQSDAPVCDVDNLVGFNDGGVLWCYQCLQASDCDAGEGCNYNYHTCQGCYLDSNCRSNEVCLRNFGSPGHNVCEPTCDAGPCPPGEFCDTEGIAGNGPDVCYQCVTALDCPNGEGCNSQTHTCGTCTGPNADGGSFDCPPASICSNYWNFGGGSGVCLPNCDARSCPADRPICAVLPALDPTDSYCFGCLQDSDCADFDAGSGAWCDTSVGLTFSCQR